MVARVLLLAAGFLTAGIALADDSRLPADCRNDLERFAAELDEASRSLADDAFRREVELIANDIRWQAIRCASRGVSDRVTLRLAGLADALDRHPTSRRVVRAVAAELTDWVRYEWIRATAVLLRDQQQHIGVDISFRKRGGWSPSDDPDNSWVGSKSPRLGEVGSLTLAKGQTVTLRHTIEWRQYEQDELRVSVFASHPSVRVPETLKLDFEKHTLQFEYQVTAGEQVGVFTLQLVPERGEAVFVTITVR